MGNYLINKTQYLKSKIFYRNHKSLLYVDTEKKENIFYLINKRNYGIDLLRIFAMINIIILHINLSTKQLLLNINSQKYKPSWMLESMSYWAVNGFGLISGIVGYKKYKFSNLIYLWIETSFYSVIFSLYFYNTNQNIIKLKDLFLSLFPILIKRHWYVNAYFSMYLFLPFINYGINELDQNIYKNIIIFFGLFYSFYDLISKIINIQLSNFHFLNNGYSSLWLIILYIIGGYFGKYIIINIKKVSCVYYIFWILIYFFVSFLNVELHIKLKKTSSKIPNTILINYLSPTIIVQAISLVMYFSKLNINNKFIQKVISFFTPLTFNTTLIHIRFFQEKSLFQHKFINWVKGFDYKYIIFKIYALSIIIYIICSFIDYLRLLLFKILKIREFCLFISKIFQK